VEGGGNKIFKNDTLARLLNSPLQSIVATIKVKITRTIKIKRARYTNSTRVYDMFKCMYSFLLNPISIETGGRLNRRFSNAPRRKTFYRQLLYDASKYLVGFTIKLFGELPELLIRVAYRHGLGNEEKRFWTKSTWFSPGIRYYAVCFSYWIPNFRTNVDVNFFTNSCVMRCTTRHSMRPYHYIRECKSVST